MHLYKHIVPCVTTWQKDVQESK